MSEVPGIYGKLPSLGDFVVRRLPAVFVDRWDSWLQDGMAASRERLGDQWGLYYSEAPAWRFVLSAGACDAQSWYGAIIPSVDRVGRFFPLTVAASADRLANPLDALAAEAWFGPVEGALADVLAGSLGLDALDSLLQALGGIADHAGEIALCRRLSSAEWERGVVISGASGPALGFAALARQALETRLGAFSVWSTPGGRYAPPATLAAQSLPSAAQFVGMMAGSWEESGWQLMAEASEPERPPEPARAPATDIDPAEALMETSAVATAASAVPDQVVAAPPDGAAEIPEDFDEDLLASIDSAGDVIDPEIRFDDPGPGGEQTGEGGSAAEAIPEDFDAELAEFTAPMTVSGPGPSESAAPDETSDAYAQLGSGVTGSGSRGPSIDDLLADPESTVRREGADSDGDDESSILEILDGEPSAIPPELIRKAGK